MDYPVTNRQFVDLKMARQKGKEFYSTAEGQKALMAESVGLPADTYQRKTINLHVSGDYGADPIGDGMFRMVPSGDIVSFEERNRRLSK